MVLPRLEDLMNRPKEEQFQLLKEAMLSSVPDKELAAELGVSLAIYRTVRKKFPDLPKRDSSAIRRANRDKRLAAVQSVKEFPTAGLQIVNEEGANTPKDMEIKEIDTISEKIKEKDLNLPTSTALIPIIVPEISVYVKGNVPSEVFDLNLLDKNLAFVVICREPSLTPYVEVLVSSLPHTSIKTKYGNGSLVTALYDKKVLDNI